MDTDELFVRLFRGRGDVCGSWAGPALREPVTPEHFHHHLRSTSERDWFGTYNVIGTRCSWGCVDIDVDDLALARNIYNALAVKEVPSWVEQTTRGYHVWVFPEDQLVDASVMRRALTAACAAVGYQPKEVFPKQTKVSAGGLGNFVRLPFNGYLAAGTSPRMMVDLPLYMDINPDPFWALLADMDEHRASTPELEALAALTPQPPTLTVEYGTDMSEPPVENLQGLAFTIWRDGPLPGSDRSTIMVHLARLLAEQDMPPQDALAVLADADRRWGKHFLDRGEAGVTIMRRIIEKAYA